MKWPGRLLGSRGSLQRRYSTATAVFAVLVLSIIFLFGHLIAGSLSHRYLEDMLLTGRHDAERIADGLSEGENIAEELQVVGRLREELFRTLEGVAQRQIIESIEVFDKDGKVVFTSEFRSTEEIPENEASHLELKGTLSDREWRETESTFSTSVPIGEVGDVVVHMSKIQLEDRIGRLRKDLLDQTLSVAVVTLFTLVAAFVLIWILIQRTRRLEKRHHEAREMAALGTLAANLAHEIRNPLNSINLNLELVEEDLRAGASGDSVISLADTRSEVSRLGRLVSDFLTYARPSEPEIKAIDLGDLVKDVHGFLAAEARERRVHFRMGSIPVDAWTLGDPGQLRQVVMNLVLNAVQAVEGQEAERRVVEIGVEEGEQTVSVVIRDRGPGVADNEIDRIREAFFTMRRGGTGLGLPIVQRVVQAHGGSLHLNNVEPFGFESRVTLPVPEVNGKMTQ
ncbi:MAG: HAMP domain-containing histidine kinase [Thermoanaerobaculales bacterium]|nr:HAMP domain-containing histidine kinase [Thermoanaerobaculales bacterium]